jgi:hypothetical protein
VTRTDRVALGLAGWIGAGLVGWAYLGLRLPPGASAAAPKGSEAYRAYLAFYHGITVHYLAGLLGLLLIGGSVCLALAAFFSDSRKGSGCQP